MRITLIGHSTVLIEANGHRILTDPWFGASGNVAYARIAPPARDRAALADATLVLVSHNHWDHTDFRFFKALRSDVPVLAPRESVWVTRLKGARNVVGLRKWEERDSGTLRITAVPALHMTFTRGFVIECAGKTVYFAGDTYRGAFMKQIGERFDLDIALMPVIAWRIPMTMGEQGAVEAVGMLSPRIVVPIHVGIRPRAPLLRGRQTPEHFKSRLREAGVQSEVRLLSPGESCEL